MSVETEVRLRSPNASIGITTDGAQLLVEGKPLVGSQLASVTPNLAGNRPLVALRNGIGGGFGIGLGMGTSRARHVSTKNCQDIRLVYHQGFAVEAAGSNAIRVKAGIEIQGYCTTLTTALSTSGAITSIPGVLAIGAAIPAGTLLTITAPTGQTQVFTTTGTNAISSGSLTVSSQTPNFAYPIGSLVSMPTVYPVTFGGRASAVIDLDGTVVSDPVAIDLTAGQVFWTRTYVSAPIFTTVGQGPYITTNAISNIGDTVLTSASLIPNLEPGQIITIDQAGNTELALFGTPPVSGTGPYTYKFATTLTKGHASGTVFGQQMPTNVTLYSDLGEGFTNDQDLAWVATAIAPTAAFLTGTTNAAASAGDGLISSLALIPGSVFTIDTAGSLETVTVRCCAGISPYRYYLSGTLALSHSSGVAITSNLAGVAGFIPNAIVADRLIGTDRPRSVVVIGDSIAQGGGHPRNVTSFATLALDAAQIPYVNTAKSGEAVYQYVQPFASMRRRKLITLGSWLLVEGATNDIYGGRTLAQFQADILYCCLLAKNRGLKVMVCTCTPRTSVSSDFWMTVAGQTITGANPTRIAYNNWLRAWQTNGLQGAYVDAIWDIANAVEVNSLNVLTQDGGFWKADASGPYTADGLHPTTLGHALMAASFPSPSIT